ncbi:MAG: hypothetical protein V2J24_09810 [Pseudomonadales bacterium]|jgi:hypothetical protein|nr:hypothetical protein [Pseudomonadales bacterium]
MAIEIVDIAGIRGVLQAVRGEHSGDELLAENRAMFFQRTDDFAACRFWFADFSGSDLHGVNPVHIRELGEIAERAATSNPALLTALVTPEDLQFALGRMWVMLTEATGWEHQAFRTRAEAADWLAERLQLPREALLEAHAREG